MAAAALKTCSFYSIFGHSRHGISCKIKVAAMSEPKWASAEATILPVGGCEDGSSMEFGGVH